MNPFAHLTFIELLRMEHEPNIILRRAAFAAAFKRHQEHPMSVWGNFGIPWLGCSFENDHSAEVESLMDENDALRSELSEAEDKINELEGELDAE